MTPGEILLPLVCASAIRANEAQRIQDLIFSSGHDGAISWHEVKSTIDVLRRIEDFYTARFSDDIRGRIDEAYARGFRAGQGGDE